MDEPNVIDVTPEEPKKSELEELQDLFTKAFGAVDLNLINRDRLNYGKRLSSASLTRVIRAFMTYTLDDRNFKELETEQERNLVAALQMMAEIKMGLKNEIVKQYNAQTGKQEGNENNG